MQQKLPKYPIIFFYPIVVFALAVLHLAFTRLPAAFHTLVAFSEGLFALGLLVSVLLLAAALGVKMLRWLAASDLTGLAKTVFSLALGLGIIAYGVFALGLLGLLQAWVIVGWLAFLAAFAWREMAEILALPWRITFSRVALGKLTLEDKLLFLLGGAILILALAQSLTPAWDYDGLMYHLQGPRQFLGAGRFYPVTENWLTFYPFTVEMLFTIGMALGSETFAKLLHLAFAVLLAIATYTRRGVLPVAAQPGWQSPFWWGCPFILSGPALHIVIWPGLCLNFWPCML